MSLCEIGGDCSGPRYFSEGATLPQKNTEVQNNYRQIHTMTEKIDGAKLLLSLIIAVSDILMHFRCNL